MSRTVPQIIEDLGGITALSQALGHKFPSKVQGWKERARIPLHHVDAVVAAATKLEKPVGREEILNASIAAATEAAKKDAAA